MSTLLYCWWIASWMFLCPTSKKVLNIGIKNAIFIFYREDKTNGILSWQSHIYDPPTSHQKTAL